MRHPCMYIWLLETPPCVGVKREPTRNPNYEIQGLVYRVYNQIISCIPLKCYR